MKIEEGRVVFLNFVLTDEKGEILEDTKDVGDFAYIHGMGDFIPKVEEILEGKTKGFETKFTLTPEDGYGDYSEELIYEMAKSDFEGFEDIYEGLDFQAETEDGIIPLSIIEIKEDTVVADGNHPFAGKTITFDLKVADVREATEEELEHGHVHVEGHCH